MAARFLRRSMKALPAFGILLLGLSVAGFFIQLPALELESGWSAEFNCNQSPNASQISDCLCVGVNIPESEAGKILRGWPLAYQRVSVTPSTGCGATGTDVNSKAKLINVLMVFFSLGGLLAYSRAQLTHKRRIDI